MLVTQRTRRRPGDLRSITAWATQRSCQQSAQTCCCMRLDSKSWWMAGNSLSAGKLGNIEPDYARCRGL